jgi:AraC family transcriptional activator of tynA and feaB
MSDAPAMDIPPADRTRPHLNLAHAAPPPQDERIAARQSGDTFLLIIQRYGFSKITLEGAEIGLRSGTFLLIHASICGALELNCAPDQQLTLRLPGANLRERLGLSERRGIFIAARKISNAIENILLVLRDLPELTPAAAHLEHAVCSLMEAAFNHEMAVEIPLMPRAGAQALERAFAIIDADLCNPDLSSSVVALKAGVPVRQLQRLFSAAGQKAAQVILDRRLRRAAYRIEEFTKAGKRVAISSIAYECGFNDLSYFNRAFRKSFGVAQGKYRKNG